MNKKLKPFGRFFISGVVSVFILASLTFVSSTLPIQAYADSTPIVTSTVSPTHASWSSKIGDFFKSIFGAKDKVVAPVVNNITNITNTTPPVVTPPPTTIIQQITKAGLTGNTGPQGLRGFTGLQGLKGDKGEPGTSSNIDTSLLVSKSFLTSQVDRIYDSTGDSIQGLSISLAKEINTKLLTVSGDTTVGGNLTVTGNITGNIIGNAVTVTNGVYSNVANLMTDIAPLTTLAESWIGPSSTTGIYFKDGNVGIGTVTPSTKLEVDGTILASNLVDASLQIIGYQNVGTQLHLTYPSSINGKASGISFGVSNNTSVIGAKIVHVRTGSNSVGDLSFYTRSAGSSDSDLTTEKMRITSTGNVGIGTTTPSQMLELSNSQNSSTYFKATNTDATDIFSKAGAWYQASTANLFTVAHGAGVTSVHFGLVAGNYSEIMTVAGNGLIIGTNQSAPVIFGTTALERMRITDGGSVGIGTTTPSYKLQVSSDIADYVGAIINDGNLATRSGLLIQSGLDDNTLAGPSTLIGFKDGDATSIGSITFGSNAVSYNTTSDERLKTLVNEQTLSSLNTLTQIKIHDFTWKGDTNNNLYSGVFAQELYTIYSHAVTKPINEEDNWMVDYSKLTPVIIASIQEMNLKIEGISNLDVENSFRSVLISWFGNATNGIADMFAGTFHAKDQICINNTCVTESQLQTLLQNSNISNTGESNDGTGDSGNTDNTENTDVCPNIDGVQTEIQAGDEINADGQCVIITGGDTSDANENTPDTTAPVITLSGESSIILKVGDTYNEAGATAKDDVDTTITVDISGGVDTTIAGTYTITYNAKDAADNHATEVTRTVTVE